MILEISVLDLFDVFSFSTAFMLGILFITTKSKNNQANLFLGLFLWSLSFEVLVSFLEGQGYELIFQATGILTIFMIALYVIKTLNHPFKPWYFLISIVILFEILGVIPIFFSYVCSISILVYILVILEDHMKQVGDFYSDIENRTLSWIKTIIYIYLSFYAFWIIEDIVGFNYEFIAQNFSLLSTILTLVMIYWIGNKGFSQPEIFNFTIQLNDKFETKENKDLNINVNKEGNKKVKIDSYEKFIQLSEVIKQEKIFLQKDLTVRDLSKQLEVNEREFSKLINLHTQKNFYHFINQFRVDEFKRLLKTDKANQLSLLGLSVEAGFHSKSTFYSAFKSSEGITPKQYYDQLEKYE